MPKLIRTGYAGYCTAAAQTFGKYVNDPDLETSFAIELFGEDRLTSDATTRHRAWELKDSTNGRKNRRTIFQSTWLDIERRRSIFDNGVMADRIKEQIDTIGIVEKWLKRQVNSIDRCLAARRVRTSALDYRSTVIILLREVQTIKESLVGRAPSDKKLPKEHVLMIREFFEDLANYYGGADELNKPDLTVAELREGLKQLHDEYLIPFATKLKERKRELSDQRDTYLEKLDEDSNEAACRDEAIENCIKSMMEGRDPLLWTILRKMGPRDFMRGFTTYVLPSIGEGFQAENYAKERIDGFNREIINALNALETGTPNASEHFQAFLEKLLSALIYGPASTGISKGTSHDNDHKSASYERLLDFIGNQIVLSHLLSPDGGLLGNTVTYDANTIIFIGRCGASEVYLESLPELIPTEEFEALDLTTKSVAVFSLPWAHTQVSNLHGMIVCEEGTWRYFDFSRFGTRLVGKGKNGGALDSWFNHKTRELEAGHTLYLGALEQDKDESLFFAAAAIKVSFYLDTDTAASIPTNK